MSPTDSLLPVVSQTTSVSSPRGNSNSAAAAVRHVSKWSHVPLFLPRHWRFSVVSKTEDTTLVVQSLECTASLPRFPAAFCPLTRLSLSNLLFLHSLIRTVTGTLHLKHVRIFLGNVLKSGRRLYWLCYKFFSGNPSRRLTRTRAEQHRLSKTGNL